MGTEGFARRSLRPQRVPETDCPARGAWRYCRVVIVKFHCPHCDAKLEAEGHVSGYETDCPHCSKKIRTPGTGIYPGLTIGDLRIERSLGRGSMGEVYLATQVTLDRRVALKILPAALTANDAAVERFMKEIRTLAKLTHPNIVSAYSAGQAIGVHYLVMAYVRGETMAARLQRKGRLAEEDALAVALSVARALQYAWERHNLLHRDIKPANIMVDEGGDIKLMDMGLSKSLHEDVDGTQPGMLMGTPHYMSPEQADCRADLDCRCDIYSLGATLYHMVTGSPPYPGTSIPEILTQVRTGTPMPANQRNPTLSAPTAALIERMMSRDRDFRPPDWETLIAELETILAEQFPDAETLATEQTEKPPRKRRTGLLLFLFLLLAGFAGADYWLFTHPDEAQALRARLLDGTGPASSNTAAAVAAPMTSSNAVATLLQGERPQDLLDLVSRRIGKYRPGDQHPAFRSLPGTRVREILDQMRNLDRQAAPYIRKGQYRDAAMIYDSYTGPWARETTVLRSAAVRLLQDEAARLTNSLPEAVTNGP